MEKWVRNKEVRIGGYRIAFETLVSDWRDVMSDGVRPEWGAAPDEKNRRVIVEDGRGIRVFCRKVGKDEGNKMYRKIVRSGEIPA